MGISHEYHSAHGRARRSRAGTGLRLAGVIAAILLLSLAVTAILENGSKESEQPQTATSSGMAENILAPLPMQGAAADSTAGESGETAADSGSAGSTADTGAAAVTLETFGPARQTAGGYTVKAHDSSTIRQPSCGQVDLSYFADAAFLGDSLTVGFSDYNINLGGALICGYTGVGPDAIVNRSAVKSSTRGEEVALDVLAAAHPKKLYLLLGTNTLTTLGAADRFLAYYGQMLDLLRQARERFDYVLIDSPAGLGSGFRLASCGADRAVVVSTNDSSALRDAQRTVTELGRSIDTIHLVMNRIQPKLMRRLRTTIDDAMDAAGLPLLGVVPEDAQVILAANTSQPLILTSRKGAALAYLNIAKRLLGERVPLMKIH